jgi:hypothetical protein
MARSGRDFSGIAASSATRSSINSVPAYGSSDSRWYTGGDRLNGYGIDGLGVTTNSGRMYNGA